MLAALPEPEAEFYPEEQNVADWGGKNERELRELEEHCGVLDGSQEERARCLCRPDLPPRRWTFKRRGDAKAINGVSAVPKKGPEKLRKLIMAVPANHAWRDVKTRENRGLGGGGRYPSSESPGSLDIFPGVTSPMHFRRW